MSQFSEAIYQAGVEMDRLRAEVARLTAELGRRKLPKDLLGDGPCDDCGGDVFVWWTDNVFWNAVIREGQKVGAERPEGFLCVNCFVKRARDRGFDPTGWRFIPDWPWCYGPTPTEPAT